jgi:hypothetical protein
VFTNGTVSVGPWSRPNSAAPHPSIFDASPYVALASTSAKPAVIGTNFTANLLGAISFQPFYLELEHASTGLVVRTHGVKAPVGNATPFAASILFNSWSNDLAPAPMILHVHNRCGSLLLSIGVDGVYANRATLDLAANPSTCGPVAFNGSSYASGSVVYPAPSNGTYPVSVPGCAGHTFSQWNTTGGLEVVNASAPSTALHVTYNGTLTARFS